MSELATEIGVPSGFSGMALEDILSGQPLYVNRVTGKLGLAQGTTEEKATIVGLASTDIANGFVGDVDDEQHYEADWSMIIGSVNLAVGQPYYVHLITPGRLTTTAPTDGDFGKFMVLVGVAVTTKILEINLQPPIGL